MITMSEKGFTPAAEAFCALSVAAKSPTMRSLFQEYDERALDQIEEAMSRLFGSLSGPEKVSVLPAHTEINVTYEGRTFRGMVRDLPGMSRRVTNLDSGTEFFVRPDTEITVEVTKVPRRETVDGNYVYVGSPA